VSAKRKGRVPYEGAGRPPLVSRGVPPERLYVRVTPQQLAALDAHAERLGVNRAEAVRRWLDSLA
jgi:hypothetical protein